MHKGEGESNVEPAAPRKKPLDHNFTMIFSTESMLFLKKKYKGGKTMAASMSNLRKRECKRNKDEIYR